MVDDRDQETRRSAAGSIGEGIRSGIGMLNAFREALEETIQEAMERGDLSPERARQAMRDTLKRMQEGFDEARDRFDFVPRRDYETLHAQLLDLRTRVEALERHVFQRPDDAGIIIEAE